MKCDFNVFERAAKQLAIDKDYHSALRIYFYMADGDKSLDGGYLGVRIGELYEALSQFYAASYWYNRAIEENPEVNKSCNQKSLT